MGRVLSGRKIRKFADKYAQEMSIKMVNTDQFVMALSGGNKQKVVLARWLGKQSNILLLDSPTRGIDIKVKSDIYNLLDDMRRQGKAILIISEEIAELIGMCDRILIMKDHKIEAELKRSKDLTDTEIIKYMI
jgi:ribose transport system ATP-binding protein